MRGFYRPGDPELTIVPGTPCQYEWEGIPHSLIMFLYPSKVHLCNCFSEFSKHHNSTGSTCTDSGSTCTGKVLGF